MNQYFIFNLTTDCCFIMYPAVGLGKTNVVMHIIVYQIYQWY